MDFFNTSGEIIGCPIIGNSNPEPLHIWLATEKNEGYIQCEFRGNGSLRNSNDLSSFLSFLNKILVSCRKLKEMIES